MTIKEHIINNVDSINTVVITSTGDGVSSIKTVFEGEIVDIPQELLQVEPYVMEITFYNHEARFQYTE
jgi:hypothetical protein